jgi:hypothetical protein
LLGRDWNDRDTIRHRLPVVKVVSRKEKQRPLLEADDMVDAITYKSAHY